MRGGATRRKGCTTHRSKVLQAPLDDIRWKYDAEIAYVLVDDDAVGQDVSEMLCKGCLARARCASANIDESRTMLETQNEPNANQDDLRFLANVHS